LYPEGAEHDALLLKAGELGSRDAQRDLGALYATGDWTGPHDAVRAAEWYRRAADRGHADAQYNLGFMYFLGEVVPSDSAVGLRWLRLAADQGEESSYRLLADLYRNGYYGVSVDPAEATRWDELYRQAQQALNAKDAEAADSPT
jgi:TPR repeat protein